MKTMPAPQSKVGKRKLESSPIPASKNAKASKLITQVSSLKASKVSKLQEAAESPEFELLKEKYEALIIENKSNLEKNQFP